MTSRRGPSSNPNSHAGICARHAVQYPITRGPDLGLLGTTDAIEEVRHAIRRVAKRRTPQLIRGESGTGKELAAEALHNASSRSSCPFIPRNMAVLRPERRVGPQRERDMVKVPRELPPTTEERQSREGRKRYRQHGAGSASRPWLPSDSACAAIKTSASNAAGGAVTFPARRKVAHNLAAARQVTAAIGM
jgi:hypothetical protein